MFAYQALRMGDCDYDAGDADQRADHEADNTDQACGSGRLRGVCIRRAKAHAFDAGQPILHVADFIVERFKRCLDRQALRVDLLGGGRFAFRGRQSERSVLFRHGLFGGLERRVDRDLYVARGLFGADVALGELNLDAFEFLLVQLLEAENLLVYLTRMRSEMTCKSCSALSIPSMRDCTTARLPRSVASRISRTEPISLLSCRVVKRVGSGLGVMLTACCSRAMNAIKVGGGRPAKSALRDL